MALAAYAGLYSENVKTISIFFQVTIISWLLSGPLYLWITRRVDALDPVALMCLFGVHFFIFGPIYQLNLAYWPYLPWSSDVESYVPIWYWWQAFMLAASFLFLALFDGRLQTVIQEQSIVVDRLQLMPIIAVVSTLLVKILTIILLGGFSGIIAQYQARITGGGVSENNTFAGLGVIVSIGNAFPIALGYLVLRRLKGSRRLKSWVFLSLFFIAIFGISFVSNGLMGSRAYVIYSIVMVVGLYHFQEKQFKPLFIIGCLFLLFNFSQIYYAFKFGGIDGLFTGKTSYAVLKERDITDLSSFGMIRDYTRMDVQTVAIHALDSGGVTKSWGRSYVGGIAAIVPSALWPNRIASFTREKSQIIYRQENPRKITNLVFGGFGELYVNFGILSIFFTPILGALFAFLRSYNRLALTGRNPKAVFFAPLVSIVPIMLLVYDSNSLLYVLISVGLIPLIYNIMAKTRLCMTPSAKFTATNAIDYGKILA